MDTLAKFGEALSGKTVLPFLYPRSPTQPDTGAPQPSAIAVVSINQRLVFYAAAGTLLLVLAALMSLLEHSPHAPETLQLLAAGWTLGVALTWPIHRYFGRERSGGRGRTAGGLERVCERLFQLDCLILVAMIAIGRWRHFGLYPLAYVLFANALIYCGLRRDTGRAKDLVWPLAALGCALIVLSRKWPEASRAPDWFDVLLLDGSLVLVFLVAALSASVALWLSAVDTAVTHNHLRLLGEFARLLSSYQRPARHDFNDRLRDSLKQLCDSDAELSYRSGTIWFLEHHKDRGAVFTLGPHYRFDLPKTELNRARKEGCSNGNPLFAELQAATKWQPDVDAPQIQTTTAAIALRFGNRPVAVMRLDRAGRPPLTLERETDFLRSVSAIVSNALAQWRHDLEQHALEEMDTLFGCDSIDEVFAKAAKLVKQELNAAACTIVFRDDPLARQMRLAAAEGLERSRLATEYEVGVGPTGVCADTAAVIRHDDVQLHRDEFSAPLLAGIERALRHGVRSWLALPIGTSGINYGVIDVVNSGSGWFSAQDEKIGRAVAVRLRAIVEKFLYIKRTEEAKEAADLSLAEATKAKQSAELIARRRQDDLMVMTHQLQAPLASIVGGITGIQRSLARIGRTDAVERLEQVHALIEDGLALCYGTFTTLAQQAGRDASFGEDQISAPDELRKLCTRLQRTNARNDLTFEFSADVNFPMITVDRNVFTSVFYSLIHNAMKYADPHSYVKLECGFERSTNRAALKVKSYGEPIHLDEREAIFTKYRRGKVIERTGRHHSGVGLGLWVARELLAAVGGEISVELSMADPRLSVFVVQLTSNGAERQIA